MCREPETLVLRLYYEMLFQKLQVATERPSGESLSSDKYQHPWP